MDAIGKTIGEIAKLRRECARFLVDTLVQQTLKIAARNEYRICRGLGESPKLNVPECGGG